MKGRARALLTAMFAVTGPEDRWPKHSPLGLGSLGGYGLLQEPEHPGDDASEEELADWKRRRAAWLKRYPKTS